MRGFTIFAMILASAFVWEAGLPAWMFHRQIPPPDFSFSPEVRGLTWVDMVFPFFIFTMGAAIPLALGRRLNKGEGLLSICLGLVKRCLILAAFAYVIGNANAVRYSGIDMVAAGLYAFSVWLALFAALVRTDKKMVNYAGWVLVVIMMAVQHFFLKVDFSFQNNDCIILILARLSLVGGLVWLLTRNKLWIRLIIWVALVAYKIFCPEIPWLGFLQYLIITLPATAVGDFLNRSSENTPSPIRLAPAILTFAAVVLQLWGLFTREVLVDGIATVCLFAGFIILVRKEIKSSPWHKIGLLGFTLLIAGVAYDPVDGGLAKEYCNLSYLLVTGGQACLFLYSMIYLEGKNALSKTCTMAGQNPMIAYTVAWFVISPFLYLIGVLGPLDAASAGHPLISLCRGLLVTCLMMAFTCLCTKFKLFWKS